MDKVTQSGAATAEETASAAEELNAQADMMKEAVAELSLLVNGMAHASVQKAAQTNQRAGGGASKAGSNGNDKPGSARLRSHTPSQTPCPKRDEGLAFATVTEPPRRPAR
jgi:methyl-accepting chemotaxis protein